LIVIIEETIGHGINERNIGETFEDVGCPKQFVSCLS
jgi:hypothetical protein